PRGRGRGAGVRGHRPGGPRGQRGGARMGYLVGVDAGQTVTKAALFDLSGNELAVASAATLATAPHPRWQERDMDEAWTRTAGAIRHCLDGVDPGDVLGVGICGHGDGVHLAAPAV